MKDYYNIVTNPIEFFSGTTNTTSPAYIEAVAIVENASPKSMGYMKNFVKSIEQFAQKSSDQKIAQSKGDIEKFSGYKNVRLGLEFLSSNVPGEEIVKNLKTMLSAIESNRNQYVDAYTKQIRILTVEYEASVYMLVTGISFAMASYTDIQQNGAQVKIVKKAGGMDKGVITKIIAGLAKELGSKDHRKYLEELIKAKDHVQVSTKLESTDFMESAVGDTMDLMAVVVGGAIKGFSMGKNIIRTVYNSMFGIIPLIRSVLYLRYKRKADTILALDEQIQFIQMNIDQLKNIKTMDETKKAEIIKKQQAVIEAFRKKSEKLRAELIETEKEAAVAIKKDDPTIKKDPGDDFIFD